LLCEGFGGYQIDEETRFLPHLQNILIHAFSVLDHFIETRTAFRCKSENSGRMADLSNSLERISGSNLGTTE
jgi:hypothetical protein